MISAGQIVGRLLELLEPVEAAAVERGEGGLGSDGAQGAVLTHGRAWVDSGIGGSAVEDRAAPKFLTAARFRAEARSRADPAGTDGRGARR